MSDSLQPHGLNTPWNSPRQNTGVSSHTLLQGIFPTRDQTQVSHIAGRFFTSWATREEELYKKDLNDPDNHNGVITNLELDILECKDKWALGSITTNKANGGDRILAELFQILK